MPELTLKGIDKLTEWENTETKMPLYDIKSMVERTKKAPKWIHFGAGNIFRGYIAALADSLLDGKYCDTGIIAVETYDEHIIKQIYKPYDNLALLVTLRADGNTPKRVIGSIAEALSIEEKDKLKEYFSNPSLQMVSLTITEKGYDNEDTMDFLTDLLYERYHAGSPSIAIVSMDNCSRNGEVLKNAVLKRAELRKDRAFLAYLDNPHKVSFPWSMIDKITPRPSDEIFQRLENVGITDMRPITTEKGTYIAPFVNAELPEYLVIEGSFPNGRPALERVGVYFTKREIVNQTERMKVTTCLNPLHTALAIFGCLLGFETIAKEMEDQALSKLVHLIGYGEGLKVVESPGILDPKEFIDEVVTERLPNAFLLDTPQRIATDTSKKVSIRFGETIKAYMEEGKADELIGIPLVLAGWLRYLKGTDDQGNAMTLSSDPRLLELTEAVNGDISSLLKNEEIFGVDLYAAGLADTIQDYYERMNRGCGAVRITLEEVLL